MGAQTFEPADPALLYVSRPINYTQPNALAAWAALVGLKAPAAATARVLELGCASAGNIIPLADHFPNASFLGLDISEAEIATGRARIAALGLTNVRLEAMDLAQFSAPAGSFDYIVVHGVYSYVPDFVRAAILRICAESLSDNGLAALSFNVLPGWRQQQIVRDICLLYAGDGTRLQRAQRAREALSQIARGAGEGHPYGVLVTQAARSAAALPLSYIDQEFLAGINQCFFFNEFQRDISAAGLHYVGEGELLQSEPDFFLPKASQEPVRTFVGGDSGALQQALDAVSGRTFRRALLAKRQASALDARALMGLHASSFLLTRPEAPNQVFGLSWQPLTPPDRALATALHTIAQAAPASVPIADVLDGRPDLLEGFLRYVGAGHVRLYAAPLAAGRAGAAAPKAFACARLEAAAGQDWVSTLDHRVARPPADAMQLLAKLDGLRTRDALGGVLRPGGEGSTADRVAKALRFCEREALLLP